MLLRVFDVRLGFRLGHSLPPTKTQTSPGLAPAVACWAWAWLALAARLLTTGEFLKKCDEHVKMRRVTTEKGTTHDHQ